MVRRLAAIMFTDMVGSTELAQVDEKAALRLLDEQDRLAGPVLSKHHGRLVKSTGDGMLVEFGSALEAVQCAVDLQRQLHERGEGTGGPQLKVRIGIHIGDVEERGTDILGDAVNIAARVEPLAEPEGVCLSAQVYEQVRNKLTHEFEKLGPKHLKGVRDAVEVYRVLFPWSLEEAPLKEPLLPRVAVLPFTNISPDPNDEYFADGLTDELISTLSQVGGLRVIARTSVSQYKGTTKPIAQIATELGVGSVLEGSVRKAGVQLRISVQLIDSRTQEHRWAQTYDRHLDNVLAIQSEVAERTAAFLKVELLKSEREAIKERMTSNLVAYDLYLRGIRASQSVWENLESEEEALRYFDEAIRKDPDFSAAHSYLANLLIGIAGDTRPGREVFPRARDLAARALELNPHSSDAHVARGNVAMQADLEWTRAEAELQQAIALNPSSSMAHAWYGFLLVSLQRFKESKKQLLSAIELDPLWLTPRLNLVSVEQFLGDWESAVALSKQLVEAFPGNLYTLGYLAQSYIGAGQPDDARRSLQALEGSEDPGLRVFRSQRLALLGQFGEAREFLRDLEAVAEKRYVNLGRLAAFHALLGDKKRALALLEQDNREGERGLWAVYLEPIYDSIRTEPRFRALLRSVNLPTSLQRRLLSIPAQAAGRDADHTAS